MKKLTLKNCRQENALLLDYEFIDHYMPEANGEYVKVYLLLLRCQSSPDRELTISGIADILDDTEKDVIRALKYWKKQGLLDYEITEEAASSAPRADTQAPEAANVQEQAAPSPENVTRFRNRKELKELLFVAEQYLGKTLSTTDMKTITYFYDELGMSTDLIEYLIEYCVENGHKSMHYIQKVALSWADRKIQTPEEAKQSAAFYSKSCYGVLKAFGITGRSPAASELAYIQRWSGEYGFSDELILEACNRTMNSIHQPSFDYAESILKSWLEGGAKNRKDVEALDLAYQKEKLERKEKRQGRSASSSAETPKPARNRFNNFEGRTYEDMEDLTRRLIQNQ
ncbi:DnaD domain protein [Lachnospiraceae bacterium DSM 108991]|uniref:DnaD domain protein n=1 Tax=Claveliimonas monacensis TaxID=2779351 RepID=A0ABR9RMC6_9FIRM|nr:DnaD domain protein [Claveliimonas monacensis]MBE5063722.1 DnaD domain protein [Claveliimonas monacensis]